MSGGPNPGLSPAEEIASLQAQVRGLQFDVLSTSILSEISKVVRFSNDFGTLVKHIFVVLELFLGIDAVLIVERTAGLPPRIVARHGALFEDAAEGAVPQALALVKAAMAGGEPVEMAIYGPRGNLIALPLNVDKEAIGCICVFEPMSLAALGEHRLSLLAMVATQIAIVLKNSALYTELQEQAQELLQMNARLIELDRLKSSFLTTISHELRTPLTVILGNADLLNGNFIGEMNRDQKESVGFIRASGKHLLGLIEDILDFSSIEGGLLKLQTQPTSLEDCFEQALERVGEELEQKRHTLARQVQPGLPRVQADPIRLVQVLENLLSNAIKFTPAGGTISIQAEQLTARPLVRIQVNDSGIGIPLEKYGQIFNRFSQLESQDNRRFSGTGLGLSIVRHLVEMMNGSIFFASEIGKGTTFSLVLHAAESEALAPPADASAASSVLPG